MGKAPLYGDNETKTQWLASEALRYAVILIVVIAAVVALTILAGCTYSGPWRASLEIRYANGKLITASNAEGGNQTTDGRDSRAQDSSETNSSGDGR